MYHRRTFHRTFTEKVSHSHAKLIVQTSQQLMQMLLGIRLSFFYL
nr:MAG TPA: hypothetical protein [Caudoviricetes sp.]